jgi:hypothetical protein
VSKDIDYQGSIEDTVVKFEVAGVINYLKESHITCMLKEHNNYWYEYDDLVGNSDSEGSGHLGTGSVVKLRFDSPNFEYVEDLKGSYIEVDYDQYGKRSEIIVLDHVYKKKDEILRFHPAIFLLKNINESMKFGGLEFPQFRSTSARLSRPTFRPIFSSFIIFVLVIVALIAVIAVAVFSKLPKQLVKCSPQHELQNMYLSSK